MSAPLVVTPTLTGGPTTTEGNVPVTIAIPAASGASFECAVGRISGVSQGGAVTLELPPGKHLLRLVATRELSTRFYSTQHYDPSQPVALDRGRAATNRTFDATGNETTSNANSFTGHVFGSQVLSPVDRWALELPLTENPWFRAASANEVEHVDCSELGDAILALEFLAPG